MSNLIFKEITDPKKYDQFVKDNSGFFTQASFYGDWHKKLGRNVYYISIENNSGETFLYSEIIEISGGFGQKYLYAPYGPIYKKENINEILPFLKKELYQFTKNKKAMFLRLDFTPALENNLLDKYFTKADKKTYKGSIFQPRDELVVDLTKDAEELLNQIHKKNRYAIRMAEKKGSDVQIIENNLSEYFDDFYKLIKETSDRNNFHAHQKEYYKEVFNSIEKNKNGYLVVTKYKDEIDNVLLFLTFNETVMFLFGGSSNKFRDVPSSHLAHFRNFLYAKGRGFKYYNFGGISTEKNPSESLLDLTRFKTRFGGFVLEHSDFYDLVVKKIFYKLFVLRKKLK